MINRPGHKALAHFFISRLADQDSGPIHLVQPFKTRGDIDVITNGRKVHALFRADIPRDDLSCTDPNTDMHGDLTGSMSADVGYGQFSPHVERCTNGSDSVILLHI